MIVIAFLQKAFDLARDFTLSRQAYLQDREKERYVFKILDYLDRYGGDLIDVEGYRPSAGNVLNTEILVSINHRRLITHSSPQQHGDKLIDLSSCQTAWRDYNKICDEEQRHDRYVNQHQSYSVDLLTWKTIVRDIDIVTDKFIRAAQESYPNQAYAPKFWEDFESFKGKLARPKEGLEPK